MPKDGSQHIESLKDGRQIYIDGALVHETMSTTRRFVKVHQVCGIDGSFQSRSE